MKILFIFALLFLLRANAELSADISQEMAAFRGMLKGMKASDEEISQLSKCTGSLKLLEIFGNEFGQAIKVAMQVGLKDGAPNLAYKLQHLSSDMNTFLNVDLQKTCYLTPSKFSEFVKSTSELTAYEWKEAILQLADDNNFATNAVRKINEWATIVQKDPSNENIEGAAEYITSIYVVIAVKAQSGSTPSSAILSTSSILTPTIALFLIFI
jgi:hypothetical protein